MRPYARRRNWLMVMVALRAIQLPLLAWAIAATIDGPIARGGTLLEISLAAGGVLALAAWTQLTFVYRQRLSMQIGEAVICDLRAALFAHLQRMPMAYYDRTKTGRMISRMTGDADAVKVGVQDVLFVTLVHAGQMAVAAAVMAYCDWRLFLVVLSVSPVMWWIGRCFNGPLSDSFRAVQESYSRVTTTIADSVTAIRVTQAMAREEVNAQSFKGIAAEHADVNIVSARRGGLMTPLLEMASQVALAVILIVGGYRALAANDPMPVGDLIQFWFLAGLFFSPIQVLGTQYSQALTAMAGAERVFELLDTPPAWQEPVNARPLHTPVIGEVRFDNVCFGYTPDRPVLQDLCITLHPGEMTAVVGETGSGKSTLASLLARYYLPQSGRVCIDGQDIRYATADSLAATVSLVHQQNFLFGGTILENIVAGRGYSERDAMDALMTLGCENLIDELPDGLATETGRGGSYLSLGQKQLVCFARAVLGDPRILILDEATAAIDSLTEQRLQRALAKLLRGRTSMIIAHRLSTIRHADRILVLDRGRLTESGDHDNLIRAGGKYAQLHARYRPAA